MMSREKAIEKIANLLDLADNNPNENEAIAAALKAQELMAKYDIELTDCKGTSLDEEISKEVINFEKNTGYCIKWRFQLASIIARNFKVKHYTIGKDSIVFYGFKSDAKIASQVFSFLFETGNKLSAKYYYKCKEEGRQTRGVMNTYLVGFMKGLQEVLEKQCHELMIVVPKKVEEEYEEMSKDFTSFRPHLSYSGDSRAYNDGREDGKTAATARSIEETA
jgi:hypothetical protein